MSEEIIKAEGLTKVFNKHLTAVENINFSVKRSIDRDWAKVAFDFAYVGMSAAIVATIGLALSWRFLSK